MMNGYRYNTKWKALLTIKEQISEWRTIVNRKQFSELLFYNISGGTIEKLPIEYPLDRLNLYNTTFWIIKDLFNQAQNAMQIQVLDNEDVQIKFLTSIYGAIVVYGK